MLSDLLSGMFKNFISAFVALSLFFLFWQQAALRIASPLCPLPPAVLAAFFEQLLRHNLAGHLVVSAYTAAVSLLLACLLAIPPGLFIGRKPGLDKLISPLLYLLYPLPKAAFLPAIVLLFGLGLFPKMLLIFLVLFFQLFLAARDAARDIAKEWVLSMRSLHASSWQIYRHLVFPAALPQLFTALRVSVGNALAVLFFAETFASSAGLGYCILDNMEKQEIPAMYAGIMALGILGIAAYSLIDLLESYVCKWNKPF